MPEKPVIDQIVVWTHAFHTAKFSAHIQESKLSEKEVEQALSVILRKMKQTVDAMAKRKKTAFVLVESNFHPMTANQGMVTYTVGINERVGRAYSEFLHHCRTRFGNRFVSLPPKVGFLQEQNTEHSVETGLRKLKEFTISKNLKFFKAGEKTEMCATTGNDRVVDAMKKMFGVKEVEMYSVAEHNFSHADAMATLVNAGIDKRFLTRAHRPEGAGRIQARKQTRRTPK